MDTFGQFWVKEFENLSCDELTKAYIVSIFSKFRTAEEDLSNTSITISYLKARDEQSFIKFQQIGDWLFFTKSLFPEHLNGASQEYYYSMGQLSYYTCYRLLNRQLKLYERLADDFIALSDKARNIINRKEFF